MDSTHNEFLSSVVPGAELRPDFAGCRPCSAFTVVQKRSSA